MASKNTSSGELTGTRYRFDRPQLAAIMKENNETHADLAFFIGITPQAFSQAWNGRHQFTLRQIRDIMIHYHLTPEQVVDIFIFPAGMGER